MSVDMVKTKWRLTLLAACLIIALSSLLLFRGLLMQPPSMAGEFGSEQSEEVVNNLMRRRLNQPFLWHQDSTPADNTQSGNSSNRSGHYPMSDTTLQEALPSARPAWSLPRAGSVCRNSVQGKDFIADDRGYLCERRHVISASRCCKLNQSERYHCQDCQEHSGCCPVYEKCISCCMNPKHREALTGVLEEANVFSNILLLSVSDHFELCLAKCRTNSKSVQHENLYIDPARKYCFKKAPSTSASPEKTDSAG